MKWTEIFKQKTTWAGLVMIVAGVGALVTGDDKSSAVMGIVNGFGLIFLRQAVAKVA